jgi:hypothetical protein
LSSTHESDARLRRPLLYTDFIKGHVDRRQTRRWFLVSRRRHPSQYGIRRRRRTGQ